MKTEKQDIQSEDAGQLSEEDFKKAFADAGLEAVFSGGRDEASMSAGSVKINAFVNRLAAMAKAKANH